MFRNQNRTMVRNPITKDVQNKMLSLNEKNIRKQLCLII